tara:strand:- start:256 stop:396 length:141 start_codon:yes stop_codon:yes gene_type:complete
MLGLPQLGGIEKKSPDIIARVVFLLYRYIYNALGSLGGPRAYNYNI